MKRIGIPARNRFYRTSYDNRRVSIRGMLLRTHVAPLEETTAKGQLTKYSHPATSGSQKVEEYHLASNKGK
jgi:hypothetical protein